MFSIWLFFFSQFEGEPDIRSGYLNKIKREPTTRECSGSDEGASEGKEYSESDRFHHLEYLKRRSFKLCATGRDTRRSHNTKSHGWLTDRE